DPRRGRNRFSCRSTRRTARRWRQRSRRALPERGGGWVSWGNWSGNGRFRQDGVAVGCRKGLVFQQGSLTLGQSGDLTRPVHRKGFLFEQPTGPGGRRSTPDSAMRPRARKCLDQQEQRHCSTICRKGLVASSIG